MLTLAAGSRGVTAAGASTTLPGVTLSGPYPTGSPTFNGTLYGTSFNLSRVGYERSEFFLSGTAHSYVPMGPLNPDGKWKVTTGATAPYKTRIAVYRPTDPSKFNGTLVVEWLNVSGGTDDGPEWTLAHNELVREGFAWVGVSAQQVGVKFGEIHGSRAGTRPFCTPATASPTTCSPKPVELSATMQSRFWRACGPDGSSLPVSHSLPVD